MYILHLVLKKASRKSLVLFLYKQPALISLSLPLTSSLKWPHFIWIGCTATGCSHRQLGHFTLDDPVDHGCDQPVGRLCCMPTAYFDRRIFAMSHRRCHWIHYRLLHVCATYCGLICRSHGKLRSFTAIQFRWNAVSWDEICDMNGQLNISTLATPVKSTIIFNSQDMWPKLFDIMKY